MTQLATRATSQYVSAYSLDRPQQIQVRRYQSRLVNAYFNGALGADESLVSVTWRTSQPWVCVMSDASVTERATSVRVEFNGAGYARLQATVVSSDGNTYLADFEVNVFAAPYDWFESMPVATGPYSLVAVVAEA